MFLKLAESHCASLALPPRDGALSVRCRAQERMDFSSNLACPSCQLPIESIFHHS